MKMNFSKTAPVAAMRMNLTEKAVIEHTEDGALNISTEEGETVSLRPDPANGDLSEAVVTDALGVEEVVELPEPGQVAYSSSSKPPMKEAA